MHSIATESNKKGLLNSSICPQSLRIRITKATHISRFLLPSSDTSNSNDFKDKAAIQRTKCLMLRKNFFG